MAQPPGLPGADDRGQPPTPSSATSSTPGRTTAADPGRRPRRLPATPAATPCRSIVADYRASAGIDVDHDQADRDAGHRLADAGHRAPAGLGRRARLRRRARCGSAWAPDLDHRTVTCGHFMAEEAPAEVAARARVRSHVVRPGQREDLAVRRAPPRSRARRSGRARQPRRSRRQARQRGLVPAVHDVRVEERRGGRAVGEAERRPGEPVVRRGWSSSSA